MATDITTLQFDQDATISIELVATTQARSAIVVDEIDFRDEYVVARFAEGENTATWLIPYSNIRAVFQTT